MTVSPLASPVSADPVLIRARHARAYLGNCLMSRNLTPGERVILNLIGQQSQDGSWGATEYPLWTDVLTALSVQALRAAGFEEDATWTITDGDRQYSGGIQLALSYLAGKRTETGWGEDIHDTCQVLIALHASRDTSAFADQIKLGISFVVDQLANDFEEFRGGDWYGPGFYAASLDLLSRTGHHRGECADILAKLPGMQSSEGYFGTPEMPIQFKVWHTSLVVMALTSHGSIPTSSPGIDRALLWLQQSQDPDTGAWGSGLAKTQVIFVAYGALALITLRGTDNPAARKAVEWMVRRQKSDGGIEVIEGTVMGAWLLPHADNRTVSQIMPITEFVEIDKVLVDFESIVEVMRADIAALSGKIRDLDNTIHREADAYLLRITHRQGAQIGFLIGVIGLIVGIVAFIFQ